MCYEGLAPLARTLMSLKKLLKRQHTTIDDVSAYLDGLDNAARIAEVYKLSAAHQRRLWELSSTAPPLTLEDFVPASLGPVAEQIHHGKNSIPVFSRFSKRFCRGVDGDMIYGYNEGPTRRLIGPGYFVLRSTEGHPEWLSLGGVVVDYYQVPGGDVVKAWPKVVPNTRGLQRFVYKHTRDFMRRVSQEVTVGRAYKDGKDLKVHFVLCREVGS